jgi:lipopolysaccharide export LptBFGC system permease protein LptF
MTGDERAEGGIARERVQRAKTGLGLRVPGLLALGLVLLYVGIGKMSQGEDVAMWVAILAAYVVAAGIAVWLMRRGVRDAGH